VDAADNLPATARARGVAADAADAPGVTTVPVAVSNVVAAATSSCGSALRLPVAAASAAANMPAEAATAALSVVGAPSPAQTLSSLNLSSILLPFIWEVLRVGHEFSCGTLFPSQQDVWLAVRDDPHSSIVWNNAIDLLRHDFTTRGIDQHRVVDMLRTTHGCLSQQVQAFFVLPRDSGLEGNFSTAITSMDIGTERPDGSRAFVYRSRVCADVMRDLVQCCLQLAPGEAAVRLPPSGSPSPALTAVQATLSDVLVPLLWAVLETDEFNARDLFGWNVLTEFRHTHVWERMVVAIRNDFGVRGVDLAQVRARLRADGYLDARLQEFLLKPRALDEPEDRVQETAPLGHDGCNVGRASTRAELWTEFLQAVIPVRSAPPEGGVHFSVSSCDGPSVSEFTFSGARRGAPSLSQHASPAAGSAVAADVAAAAAGTSNGDGGGLRHWIHDELHRSDSS
jgi:hypothetical protein